MSGLQVEPSESHELPVAGGVPEASARGEVDRQSSSADGSAGMFDAIARRYDLLNRMLSLGVDQHWRRRTIEALELGAGTRVLDLATGTADLAILAARSRLDAIVQGLDPSPGMLAVARSKITRAGLDGRIGLHLGDAQRLPFADQSFDACSMAFGIRNVENRPAALREMARVTRLSGRVAILELTEPVGGLLAPVARWHVHQIVPRVGALLSGQSQYRYLQESIAAFPSPAAFAATMTECGLELIEARPLTFGVCHLFVARPERRAP